MSYYQHQFTVTRETTRKAQRLRRESTPAERKLWLHLRGKQADGLQFRRQHPVGPFIVDFYCADVKLAIELDGDSHGVAGAEAKDRERTSFLHTKGVSVLRFWNGDVHENPLGVVERIIEEARRLKLERGTD